MYMYCQANVCMPDTAQSGLGTRHVFSFLLTNNYFIKYLWTIEFFVSEHITLAGFFHNKNTSASMQCSRKTRDGPSSY